LTKNLEKRLKWMETAFKKEEEGQTHEELLTCIQDRVSGLLNHDHHPEIRQEIESLRGEVTQLSEALEE